MISLTIEKAHGDYDPGTSKFFGAPTLPETWLTDGTVGTDDFFFCQLKAAEYTAFDPEALLPDSGFLYFFLREEDGRYLPNIRWFPDEPETIVDDFNAGFPDGFETDYSIDFSAAKADPGDGTALLAGGTDDEIVLLRYDPLDDGAPPFLAETEKLACFLIKKEDLKNKEFKNVRFTIV